MKPSDFTVEDLLPHRDRMLLISQVIDLDDQGAVAGAVVTDQWPLVEGAHVSCLVLIELVAQTAGMNNTWTLIQQQGPDADNRGWIVGIKAARFFTDRIAVGTRIVIEARNSFEFENFREIQGIARIDERRVAEVTLQLMQADAGVMNE